MSDWFDPIRPSPRIPCQKSHWFDPGRKPPGKCPTVWTSGNRLAVATADPRSAAGDLTPVVWQERR